MGRACQSTGEGRNGRGMRTPRELPTRATPASSLLSEELGIAGAREPPRNGLPAVVWVCMCAFFWG